MYAVQVSVLERQFLAALMFCRICSMQHVACSLKKSLAEAWCLQVLSQGGPYRRCGRLLPLPQIRRSEGVKWHGMKATSQVLSRKTTLSLTFSGNPGTYILRIHFCLFLFLVCFCLCVCLFLATAIVDSLTFCHLRFRDLHCIPTNSPLDATDARCARHNQGNMWQVEGFFLLFSCSVGPGLSQGLQLWVQKKRRAKPTIQ